MKYRQVLAGLVVALIVLYNLSLSRTNTPVEIHGDDVWVGTTIYIRPDGTVDPPDAPIVTYDYETYIVVSNIQIVEGHGIVIEKDNVILDGGGYTLRGQGPYYGAPAGIYLYERTNITVRNLAIAEFGEGIYVAYSSEIVLFNNTLFNVWRGMYIVETNTATITNNKVQGTGLTGIGIYYTSNIIVNENIIETTGASGIFMAYGSNVEVKANTILNCWRGFVTRHSQNVTIRDNVIRYTIVDGSVAAFSTDVIIENNTISNTGQRGLYIWGLNNAMVMNNSITNTHRHAIDVYDSRDISILHNTISGSQENGVIVWLSRYITISYNNILNTHSGVYLLDSHSVWVTSNYISDFIHNGIAVEYSHENYIDANTIVASNVNTKCIYLLWSNNNVIVNNELLGCGLYVEFSYSNSVTGNTVNNKPLVYLEEVSGIEVTGEAGQVIVIRGENVMVRGLHISNTTIGIQVLETSNLQVLENTIEKVHGGLEARLSNNVIVHGNTVVDASFGIRLGDSSNIEIYENTIESATAHGIELYGSNSIIIKENSIRNIYSTGIRIDSSSTVTLEGNTVTNTGFAGADLIYSSGIVITNNRFENTVAGVRVSHSNQILIGNNTVVSNSDGGLTIQYSAHVHVINNTIINISGVGILIFLSDHNVVENNHIEDITSGGIKLLGSVFNTIKNNYIGSTEIGVSLEPSWYWWWGWSDDNIVIENTIENCYIGLYLYDSWYNHIKGNTIRNNYIGVEMWYVRTNMFLRNNFINNTMQIKLGDGIWWNVWNDEFVGNYWSDHVCVDEDDNGVCDNPYIIYFDNIDWRPSKYPYPFEVVYVDVHRLVTFVRASGGDVWFGLIGDDGSVDWRPLGGIVADAPSAAFYNGRIYVVARSEDGALWYGVIKPPKWDFSGWKPLPGLAASKPSIVATDYGIVIGVRDINNGMWVGLLGEEGVTWFSIPGLTVDTPALAYADGTLHIVVRGLDGYTLWHGTVELPSFEFKGWKQIYGFTNSAPELIAVGDTLILAVRDLGNGIALATYSKPIGWLGWMFIPGGLTDAQPNIEYFNGELTIIVKALGDYSIWLARKDHYGFWYWTNLPGLTTHEPDMLGISFTYYYVVPKT